MSLSSHCRHLQVAEFVVALLVSGYMRVEEFGKMVLAAGQTNAEEGADTDLVDSGTALKVMVETLKAYAAAEGSEKPLQEWKASGLGIKRFLPEVSHVFKFSGVVTTCFPSFAVRLCCSPGGAHFCVWLIASGCCRTRV